MTITSVSEKKLLHTERKPCYPIKPQPCYNGHLSTTDMISCCKVAVTEMFGCYSNYDIFTVANKNASIYWKF